MLSSTAVRAGRARAPACGTRAGRTLPLCLLLAACASDRPPPAATGTATTDTAGAGYGAAAVCLQGESFTADGPVDIATAAPGAAAPEVGALRWDRHDGCERVVIDLNDGEGAPAAGAPVVRAELLRSLGIVRVTLPDTERARQDATDARFDGDLARAAYVVRSDGGAHVFVDIHLAAAAEAHVGVLADPARVVVDLRPGGAPLGTGPVTGTRVVVLRPRQGATSYPLEITGYARTFEANVVARLEQGGRDVTEQFTTATSWLEAWGWFSMTFADGPTGPLLLHVGEYSAKDGSWEGVRVDLDLRR